MFLYLVLTLYSVCIGRVHGQTCNRMNQYQECARYSGCLCFIKADFSNTTTCVHGFLLSCSELLRCKAPNNTCSQSGYQCIYHPRCHNYPICYPVPNYNLRHCAQTCGPSTPTVLLLSDTSTAAVQILATALQTAGLTVNSISGGITTYSGTPDAAIYGAVVLITGNSYLTDMPTSGQQSIVNAQNKNGTGIIITEWGAYQVLSGRWTILSSLLLAPRVSGFTGIISFTLISTGHPIWNGLPTTFTTSATVGCSPLGTLRSGSVEIASSTLCVGPGVIVSPCISTDGRIVQIAHASHYSGGTFNWGNDANLLTMMTNAVEWAAQLI